MSIFEAIRNSLNLSDIAKHYGLTVTWNGFVKCPFHNDRHPSMKLYKDHYHCFACGAHGDVTDLTAKLYGMSTIEAAHKLASDFGIEVGSENAPRPRSVGKRKPYLTEDGAYALLREYVTILNGYCERYYPGSPQEEIHPLYKLALDELPIYECWLDIFTNGTKEEQLKLLSEGRRFFDELRAKLRTARMAA